MGSRAFLAVSVTALLGLASPAPAATALPPQPAGVTWPSAGVSMATALVSLVSGRKVKPKVGMTGEITLRGQVLPIGGVKEKVLAAHRNGLRTASLPRRNEQDLDDVPDEIKKSMKFVFVDSVDDVIQSALEAAKKASSTKTSSTTKPKKAASRKTKGNGKDTTRRR